MKKRYIRLAQLAVILFGCTTPLVQLIVVFLAREIGKEAPEVAHLVIPYSTAGVISIGFFQLFLAGIWYMLHRVSTGAFYTAATLRTLDLVRVAFALSVLIPIGLLLHATFGTETGVGPASVVLLFLMLITAGPGVFLLLTVLRQLFIEARANREELEKVI
ncbi:DUF2975 domain-containing protein [Schaalia sp. Marseille-Q2122]|uniref:DUF2975 domain-containing protein n=1 Tax=Schaalia sp. Marseille-Q2122 TaxID=2736604 RepID=UPI00158A7BB9|nr:DUF2975 domain-containing protein [Schaalia sp. Marseille-Q2122]